VVGKSGSLISQVDGVLDFVTSPEFASLKTRDLTEEDKAVLIEIAPAAAQLAKSLINHDAILARSFVAIMDGKGGDIKILDAEKTKVMDSAKKLQTDMEETLPGIVETLTKTRMTKGRITLIVLACIAGVLLVGIVVYCFCCKSKPRSQPPVSPPVGHAPNASNPGHEGYAAPGYAAHASNPGHEGYRA